MAHEPRTLAETPTDGMIVTHYGSAGRAPVNYPYAL
jgi:hypothetical protein